MLHRLIFDTTDAASIAASANVGAYLRASDGTLLTHTGGALDVNFTATDLDIRDLVAATDSVSAWTKDGTGNAITSTSGALDVNIDNASIAVTDNGGSLTVDATDLDIRDLDFSTDSVTSRLNDGAGNSISSTAGALDVNIDNASIAVTDNGGSLTVDSTDFDIRDLAAATDSVSAWVKDGTGTAITSTGGALDINIKSGDLDDSLANTALVAGSTSIGTTVGGTDLRATDLANRKWLMIYNNGNKDVYIGTSGVTAATGFPLFPGAMLELRAGPAINAFAISSTGTQDIRTLELS